MSGVTYRLPRVIRARLKNLPNGWYTDFFGRRYFPRPTEEDDAGEDTIWFIRLPWRDRTNYEKGNDVWFPEDGEDVFVFNAEGDTQILSLVRAVDSSPRARLKRKGDFVMESPHPPTPYQTRQMRGVSNLIALISEEQE